MRLLPVLCTLRRERDRLREYCDRRLNARAVICESTKVWCFTHNVEGFTLYMGRDKFENEELIKWGFDEDSKFAALRHSV